MLRGPGHQYDSPIGYQENVGGATTTVQENAPEVEENVEIVDEEVRLSLTSVLSIRYCMNAIVSYKTCTSL